MSLQHTSQDTSSGLSHIAFIMDGNRRWAKERGLGPSEGHKEGGKAAERVVEWVVEQKIPHTTLWALSTENWKKRSQAELSTIFSILGGLPAHLRKFQEHGVSVDILGNREVMPAAMRATVETVENALRVEGSPYQVHIALNYGGRDELLCAIRALIAEGITHPTVEDVSARLFTRSIPDVDLIVRTGGDQRLSGFMLWQSEYAELAFLEEYWPTIDKDKLDTLLESFAQRKRNFGA